MPTWRLQFQISNGKQQDDCTIKTFSSVSLWERLGLPKKEKTVIFMKLYLGDLALAMALPDPNKVL